MGLFSFLRNLFIFDTISKAANPTHRHNHHYPNNLNRPDAPYMGDFGADLDANHLDSGRYDITGYEDSANWESPEDYEDYMNDCDDFDRFDGGYDDDDFGNW